MRDDLAGMQRWWAYRNALREVELVIDNRVLVRANLEKPKTLIIFDFEVFHSWRGMGYGRAALRELREKDGYTWVVVDGALQEAVGFWRAMYDANLVDEIYPINKRTKEWVRCNPNPTSSAATASRRSASTRSARTAEPARPPC